MIKIVDGDLLKAKEDIIGHQVNCKGIMGGGIALQIKKKYPNVFVGYKSECFNGGYGRGLLGKCQIIKCEGKDIANLFGQYSISNIWKCTDENKLKEALESLMWYAKLHNKSVALPYKIGCYRGGADWKVVYKIIEEVFERYDVTLYRLDLK